MKTGAAYIRVSTEMQTELSPDSQLKLIKQYAKQNDIILNERFIFADDGISGRTAEKRPEFMRMIATAKAKPKPFDVILVWKFSRFARNREDSIVYKSMLRKECGIEVISVSEPVGEDKTSILIEALLEAMDEYYSINLAEEVKRGMLEKVSRGGIVGAPPFGYRIKDGIYVPDEKEAPIVKMIFEKYLAGTGTRAIASELNDLGIKTKAGNNFANRNIDYILTNPTYIGKLRWNTSGKATTSHSYRTTDDTIIVDGKHEPIIDKEIFERTQKQWNANKAKYPKHYQQRKIEYYFRGLVRCSDCGATLVQLANGKSLQCHNYARGQCRVSHCITLNKLRDAVIIALDKDADRIGILNFVKPDKPKENKSRNELIREQIEKEKTKLERVKTAYEDGIDTIDEYRANKLKITEKIKHLEEKINAADNSDGLNKINIEMFKKKLLEVRNIISQENVSPQDFNSALRECIDRIVFDRKKNEVSIFYRN